MTGEGLQRLSELRFLPKSQLTFSAWAETFRDGWHGEWWPAHECVREEAADVL